MRATKQIRKAAPRLVDSHEELLGHFAAATRDLTPALDDAEFVRRPIPASRKLGRELADSLSWPIFITEIHRLHVHRAPSCGDEPKLREYGNHSVERSARVNGAPARKKTASPND